MDCFTYLFYLKIFNLFLIFAACGLSPVVESVGFSLQWLSLVWPRF